MDSQKEPGIRIGQIFLSRALLGHVDNALQIPTNAPVPEHQITVTVSSGITENRSAGIVTFLVQTTADNPGFYQFTVEMVALIEKEPGAENMTIEEYLSGPAHAAMFPFVREAVANLTGRGRFGPVWLKPLNLKRMKEVTNEEEAQRG